MLWCLLIESVLIKESQWFPCIGYTNFGIAPTTISSSQHHHPHEWKPKMLWWWNTEQLHTRCWANCCPTIHRPGHYHHFTRQLHPTEQHQLCISQQIRHSDSGTGFSRSQLPARYRVLFLWLPGNHDQRCHLYWLWCYTQQYQPKLHC